MKYIQHLRTKLSKATQLVPYFNPTFAYWGDGGYNAW